MHFHEFATFKLFIVSTSRFCYLVAPEITITTTNTLEGATAQLQCSTISSPPNAYIFGWNQVLNSEVVRSTATFAGLSVDKRVLTLDPLTYQDAGMYTCIASNGVPKGGVTEQTGRTNLSLNGTYTIHIYASIKVKFLKALTLVKVLHILCTVVYHKY